MKSPKSVDELLAAITAGLSPEFLFFWGHQASADGVITKSCLSQWWESPFTVEGVVYPTAEHFMMASKARLFGDEETLEEILAGPPPEQAKKLGRTVANFNVETWAEHRTEFVVVGNQAKFTQNPALAEFLLSTGNSILVEASPVDRVWGIGLAADHPEASQPECWSGRNLLGFALMEVRERLRAATPSS